MQFESTTSKLPKSIKFSFLCHQFDMSLTDAQLPMFMRLYELLVAIWFEGNGVGSSKHDKNNDDNNNDINNKNSNSNNNKCRVEFIHNFSPFHHAL